MLDAFKRIFKKIAEKFDERLEWEDAALAGNFYKETAFNARVEALGAHAPPVPAYDEARALIRPLPPQTSSCILVL